MIFRQLRSLSRKPTAEQVRGAVREVYLTVFAFLAVPGLLLGLAFGWQLRASPQTLLVLVALSLVLGALIVWLASRGRAEEETPLAGAVRASTQLASAPAVPFLMGCALLGQPLALAVLWGVALCLLLGGWFLLRA